MESRHPLFWHQGLFLQPQHFQLSDRYTESLLIPYQRYLVPHLWGAYEVAVHKAALGTRSFQLASGTFLFPDGTHVCFPDNAVAESRTFEESWVAGGKPFTVYLGLSKWNDAGVNVTEPESREALSRVSTRFVVQDGERESADLHAGGPQGEVKRLQYVLKVFWESEIDLVGDYLLIPVAQLERTHDGVELSPSFIPPALTLGSVPLLYSTVKEIRDQLVSRSRQLEGYKRQRGIQTSEFGSRDVVYLLALRSLNRFVPLLCHYSEARQVHPWLVYGLLRQLIGELSSFSESVTVQGESAEGERLLPEYDHGNLGSCFQTAHLLILRLLDDITAGPEYVIPLHYDGTYFAAELKQAHFEHRHRYYLALHSAEDPAEVVPLLESLAKLGARERLPLLIARALPGVGLEHLPAPPQELPRRPNCSYFALDSHSELWTLVEKGHNIALYWDSAPADLQVELMIVGRS
jgi:type VI secretion system protein ImpJ